MVVKIVIAFPDVVVTTCVYEWNEGAGRRCLLEEDGRYQLDHVAGVTRSGAILIGI